MHLATKLWESCGQINIYSYINILRLVMQAYVQGRDYDTELDFREVQEEDVMH